MHEDKPPSAESSAGRPESLIPPMAPAAAGPSPAPLPPDRPASRSLQDVHSSVSVQYPGFFKRLFAFLGPAYLISVGYMDPGNWATDIEGGAKFQYQLIWILLMSNAMAVLLQTLAARLGIVSGRDLAQACGEAYSRPIGIALWVLCEIAVAACDLAEVIGTVIGLNLLFGLDPIIGLVITGFDTFLFLAIQRLGIRKTEAFIVLLVGTIGFCFLVEILLAQPGWSEVVKGFLPSFHRSPPFAFSTTEALYVAIGIIGATVMPHNLYLHSALVQTRRIPSSTRGIPAGVPLQPDRFGRGPQPGLLRERGDFGDGGGDVLSACRIVVSGGRHPVAGLRTGCYTACWGRKWRRSCLPSRCLAAGQSSTLTGTLAGQVVMEGFLNFRLRPWMRRLVTRLVAIVPALLTILFFGASQMTNLLVASQVILSLQLPFAVVPLLQFTNERARMGEFTNPGWVRVLGWITAWVIIVLNAYLVWWEIGSWIAAAGPKAIWIELTVIPAAIACGLLLAWLIVQPRLAARPVAPTAESAARTTAEEVASRIAEPQYRRIGVALDHSPNDAVTLEHAAALARGHGAEMVLIHVVEGVGGQMHGADSRDLERQGDQAYLEQLARSLRAGGSSVRSVLRFGNPARELSRTVADEKIDLLVLGSHGHGKIGDWFFGETAGTVRHAVRIPVLAVRDSRRKEPRTE